ncbi:MAG: GerMN domain-containing protein [Clostridiales bacterium]
MKKTIYVIFVIIIVILTILIFIVNGQRTENKNQFADSQRTVLLEDAETTNVTVYFATEDKNYLVPINCTVNATKEVAKVALEKLIAGPATPGLAAVLPEETKLLDVYALGRTVVVNFTADFKTIAEEDAQLAIAAIVATVLPLTDEYTLSIMVEGQALKDFYGLTDDMPFVEQYLNATEDVAGETAGIPAIYYLPDQNGLYLVPQTFLFSTEDSDQGEVITSSESTLDQDQSIALSLLTAEMVLAKLLDGPAEDSSLLSVFWPGTRVLDVDIVDRVVYVDFSRKLLDYGGGAAYENMMLDCLLYSLCGIEGIDAVQILIEGAVLDYLPEGRDISIPLKIPYLINSAV